MALERILERTRKDLARRMKQVPVSSFGRIAPSDRSFEAALRQRRTGFVLECKQASPSEGLIRAEFDPGAIAREYAPFADAISVLTDTPYFG
ncbi:MAG: bifunctional indole-3-glycerol phosphate synthase/phosphoribosylanthranilate isomerase, partial [Gemmatimonadota bacterium]